MKTTIEELKRAKEFTVEQWYGITYTYAQKGMATRSGGYKTDEYKFIYNPTNKCLYVSGSVFEKKQYQVVNTLEVLFKIAQGSSNVTVKLDELSFDIHNLVLQLDNN